MIKKAHIAPKTFQNKGNPMYSFSNFNLVEPFRDPIENVYSKYAKENKAEHRPQKLYIEKNISKFSY